MISLRTLVLCCFLPVVAAGLAQAQGTYTQIDFPGALDTACFGINKAGDITGDYLDSMNINHGFLLSGGTYTTIDYPGAQSTSLYRINDLGEIVGVADDNSFLYDLNTQTFTSISYPGASRTFALSINNAGVIAGFYASPEAYGIGFELVGSSYRSLPPLKAHEYVWGITGMGGLVGYAEYTGSFDFSFNHGRYQKVTIPDANLALILGVNKAGTALVGTYDSGSGFVYQKNVLQPLKFPGGGGTYAYDVNNAGEVVGPFLDSSDNQHCFTWVPPATSANR
jgi:uncharacterized membrane protein